jgi:hypothetical protein
VSGGQKNSKSIGLKIEDKSGSSDQFVATKCFRNTSNEFWLQVRIGLETFQVGGVEEIK